MKGLSMQKNLKKQFRRTFMRKMILGLVVLVMVAAPITAGQHLTADDVALKAGTNGIRGELRVMTRNLYVGADVDRVIAGEEGALQAVMDQLFSTSYTDRARGLANEIFSARPHLIGIQEASYIAGLIPGVGPIQMDYVVILRQILASYGLVYNEFRSNENVNVTMPLGGTDYIQLVDYDAILVRNDVETSDYFTKNYLANFSVPLTPTILLPINRSFSAITAKVGKKSYRFVNTHLEPVPDYMPDLIEVQMGQAQELLGYLQSETLPVIVVGDFNTEATGAAGETYNMIVNNGYVDVWTRNLRRRNRHGFTASHDKDLRNTTVTLDQRIDLIFVRSNVGFCGWHVIGPVYAWVVGDELHDRVNILGTEEWIWPSDHAGVVARLWIPQF
jgi:endonuclease/exonuclease/phosphatase family metal-dependent hydrolase